MSTDTHLATPGRTHSRWWRLALHLSLVLNLFLVGLIAGHIMRSGVTNQQRDTRSILRLFNNATKNLSAADAAKFDAVIRANSSAYAQSAQALAVSRAELRRQILAEPFDRSATLKAYADWQGNLNTFVTEVGDSLIQALSAISPEGRRQVIAGRLMATPADGDASRP
jgi:hypothetical protein